MRPTVKKWNQEVVQQRLWNVPLNQGVMTFHMLVIGSCCYHILFCLVAEHIFLCMIGASAVLYWRCEKRKKPWYNRVLRCRVWEYGWKQAFDRVISYSFVFIGVNHQAVMQFLDENLPRCLNPRSPLSLQPRLLSALVYLIKCKNRENPSRLSGLGTCSTLKDKIHSANNQCARRWYWSEFFKMKAKQEKWVQSLNVV